MRWWLFSIALAAFAQSSGEITGAITDADGAAVPGMPVQATHAETKAVFKTTSSALGDYTLTGLPAGAYEVSVDAPPALYRPYFRKDVMVRPGTAGTP